MQYNYTLILMQMARNLGTKPPLPVAYKGFNNGTNTCKTSDLCLIVTQRVQA